MKHQYNPNQTIFCLNYLSNLAGLKIGTPAQLQEWMEKTTIALLADKSVISLIGKWRLCWGPVVVSEGKDIKNKVASNTMLVLRNETEDSYIISIAGTNGPSRYGWFTEDFRVYQTIGWKYNLPDPDLSDNDKPENPLRISYGTSDGLNILRKKMVSGGKTIQEYLKSVFRDTSKQAQVIVTGHSLGGALSASLALSLLNQQAYWDPNRMATVSAMPTAGASPGNQAFANYYGELLGTRTYRVWNDIDPVPNGWQRNTVLHMPWLYFPYFSPGLIVSALPEAMALAAAKGASELSPGGPYAQLLPQTGAVNGAVSLAMIHNLDDHAFRKIVTVLYKIILAPKVKNWLAKIGIPEIVQNAVIAVIKLASETSFGAKTIEALLEWIENKLNGIKDLALEKLQKFIGLLRFLVNELLNLLVYVEQVLYQHTTAYVELFGIVQFADIYKTYSSTYKGHEAEESSFEEIAEAYADKLIAAATEATA